MRAGPGWSESTTAASRSRMPLKYSAPALGQAPCAFASRAVSAGSARIAAPVSTQSGSDAV
jgi:hypothetical protein